MTSKEWFALGVRLFGVWLITQGLSYVESFISVKLYPTTSQASDYAASYLIFASLDFAMAAFFLLGTRVVVGWTYDNDAVDNKDGG